LVLTVISTQLSSRSSEFAEQFHDAEGFGWAKTSPPVDVKKLISRKVGWMRC